MICGLMHTRNDAWCIGYTARAAVQWVDKLLVYAHACADGTLDILDQICQEYPGKLCIFVDPDPNWPEMDHRQYMLEWARQLKATHIAIIDSDESLTANLIPTIRELIESTPANKVLAIPGIQLWRGLGSYRIDHPFNTTFSLAFKDHLRLSYRPKPNGDQHHNGRQPMPLVDGHKPEVQGGIFHLQFVRWNTLRYKQLRYALSEFLKHGHEYGYDRINRRYNWWNFRPVTTVAVPEEWISYDGFADPSVPFLDLNDSGGWYADEVHRIVEQHGKEKFSGLSDFGLGVLK